MSSAGLIKRPYQVNPTIILIAKLSVIKVKDSLRSHSLDWNNKHANAILQPWFNQYDWVRILIVFASNHWSVRFNSLT